MNKERIFPYLMAGLLLASVSAVPARAEMAIGRIPTVTQLHQCPSGDNFDSGMTCYSATVTGCPNVADLSVTFGYEQPNGTPNGLIVLFSGDGGKIAAPEDENIYTHDYVRAGYEVFELAWATPWEDTGQNNEYTYGIGYAACRPATLLNYIYNHYLPSQNPHAGMCAQGFSGGSAALGYALAWYGGGGDPSGVYLDKVELLSGPTLSDIKQGCIEPPATSQTVCQGSPSWCQLGTPPGPYYQAPWTQAPAYADSVLPAIQNWTGDHSCGDVAGLVTSPASNQNWLNMSIVNGTSGPTFNYATKVTGWLCASVYDNLTIMNNSSPQGWVFYSALAASPNTTPLALYAVQSCDGAEGVHGQWALAPALPTTCDPNRNNQYCAHWAVKEDMSDPLFNPTGYCRH